MSTSSDCLVLLVESMDTEINQVLGKVYVLYDSVNDLYLVRGRNINDDDPDAYLKSFSFVSYGDNYDSIVDFIDLFSTEEQMRITLYNFDDLPLTSEEIKYEYLEEYSDVQYEVLAFRSQNFSRSSVKKMLRMIKNLFNYY